MTAHVRSFAAIVGIVAAVALVVATTACTQAATEPDESEFTTAPADAPTIASADEVAATPGCASGTASESDEVSGQTYVAEIYVPAAPGRKRRAAVIDLHGLNSDGPTEAAQTGFRTLADTEGFVVAEPTGLPTQLGVLGWEIEAIDQPDRADLAYIGALIDRLVAEYCVDPERVMVAGMSNGGLMAAEIGCRMPDRVRVVVAVAGYHRPAGCATATPVAELAIHGTDDPVVPFAAGGRSLLLSDPRTPRGLRTLLASSIADKFSAAAASAGCGTAPTETRTSPSVLRRTFPGCPPGADHELVIVEGGGHTWPGAPIPAGGELMGTTSTEFSATELAWEFFTQATSTG